MRLIFELGLPAAMGVILIVIVFLMRQMISFVIGLPLYILIIVAIIPMVIIFIMFSLLLKILRFGREGFVFMRARNDGLPVLIDTEIGTGNSQFVVGEKTNPKDVFFKDQSSGVKVDPSLVSAYAEPLRFPDGLDIYSYAFHSFLPQTTRNHLAFKAIINYRHTEPDLRELDFLSDKEFIELISKPEHFLEADLVTKIGKYYKSRKDEQGNVKYFRQYSEIVNGETKWFEEEIEVPTVNRLIMKAKGDIAKLPITEGYYSMNEAFKFNSVSYTAQHLAQLKILIEKQADERWQKILNWMQYGMVIIGIIIAGGVAVYIASMAFGKGG